MVNAPVAGTFAPIGKLSAYPPVTCALAVLKLVILPVVAYMPLSPVNAPPVITTLLVLKFCANSVVILPLVAFNTVDVKFCALAFVNTAVEGSTAPIGMLLIPLVPVPPRIQTGPVGAAHKLVAALKLLA